MQLVDLPCVGGRFVWFNGSGNAMSHIDRFLLSDLLISLWNISVQWIRQCDMWVKMDLKEDLLRNKLRQLWLKEGDSNSHFFHNSIKERQRRNFIMVKNVEDQVEEDVKRVKIEIKSYFENFFYDSNVERPVPCGVRFNSLNVVDRRFLESEFTEEEIKAAV
ncbi:unnamed protein product [Lathyrus sativus]|nr:unnamed protein product [Lathyrus sativus]